VLLGEAIAWLTQGHRQGAARDIVQRPAIRTDVIDISPTSHSARLPSPPAACKT